MSTLKRPKVGNYELIKNDLNISKNYLETATSKANLSSPSDFQLASYISSLRTKINSYTTECENISRVLLNSENNYENIFSNYKNEINNFNPQIIKEREQLI